MTAPAPARLPKVLVLESDADVARRLVNALARARVEVGDCEPGHAPSAQALAGCTVVDCVGDLRGMNLDDFGVCLAATALCDAVGPDIITRIEQQAPKLPVVVVGPTADLAMAPEFIKAGAADVLVLTGHELVTVPLALRKAIVQQQLKEENEALHHNLSRSAAELAEANARLEGTVHRLQIAVRTDELTELMNRRWLDVTLEARWIEAQRHDQDLGVIMIDLDRFKQLNDCRGHQAGDEVLRLVGRVLRDTCREIDTAARYGGDEFCVLLPHADMKATMAVAHRILNAFHAAIDARALQGTVDMSIGVACRSMSQPQDSQSLLVHADAAMYTAKGGANRIAVHGASPGRWTLAG